MSSWFSILLAFLLSAIAVGVFLGIAVTIYAITMSSIKVFIEWLDEKIN